MPSLARFNRGSLAERVGAPNPRTTQKFCVVIGLFGDD
jgi:hypothetical protein